MRRGSQATSHLCAPRTLAGSSAYPATLFTNAPPAVLAVVLAAGAVCPAGHPAGSREGCSVEPLLCLHGLAIRTPVGRLAVADLDLQLRPGQHLLISGEVPAALPGRVFECSWALAGGVSCCIELLWR